MIFFRTYEKLKIGILKLYKCSKNTEWMIKDLNINDTFYKSTTQEKMLWNTFFALLERVVYLVRK